jgi:hypothetical protein
VKRVALVLLCAMLACTREPAEQDTVEHGAPDVDAIEPAPEPPSEPAAWGTPLIREGHDVRITEVWLDDRASAALSLDGFGQVRLWPTLAAGEKPEAFAPIRLPIHEPGALSFARTDAGFVIAAIDTARSGRVLEVRIDAAGEARMLERFTIPPTDPLLELHVLSGGERLLALGADHRIRLYDGHGQLLSELREHGFIPWQLRVQANRIVAVLGGPTRVQTIELHDDRLARVGELRTTLLDRGANHNDLQLTPDGKRVAVFRRPSSKGREWSLQLIDLDDGEVRVLAGKVDGTIRPRLHLVDDRRALLEDGSGVGYWIDLDQGVAREPGFVLPEDLDDLPDEADVEVREVPLPHAHGRERWHASVVAGIRAVPGGRQLVLDPVDEPDHRSLGHASAATSEVALSADGSHVAFDLDAGKDDIIVVTDSAAPEPTFTVPGFADDVYDLAFVDDEHLLVMSGPRATILAWRTGEPLAEHVDEDWISDLGVRRHASGGLEYALRTSDKDLLLVVNRKFVVGDHAGTGDWAWSDSTRAPDVVRTFVGPEFRVEAFQADADLVAASPCGRWLAIVEDHSPRGPYGKGRIGPLIARLAVYALGEGPPTEVWTMRVVDEPYEMDLAWSADGERLAIAERSVGVLIVTAGGEVVFERRYGEPTDTRAPDEPPKEP